MQPARRALGAGLGGIIALYALVGFVTGRTATGWTSQALITVFFGVGVIWAFIDGIVILAGRPTDPRGRPLRP